MENNPFLNDTHSVVLYGSPEPAGLNLLEENIPSFSSSTGKASSLSSTSSEAQSCSTGLRGCITFLRIAKNCSGKNPEWTMEDLVQYLVGPDRRAFYAQV